MSKYEILSIVLGCFAAFVSLIVWFGQRKMQKEANDLQRAAFMPFSSRSSISSCFFASSDVARLSFDIFKGGKTYRFRIPI